MKALSALTFALSFTLTISTLANTGNPSKKNISQKDLISVFEAYDYYKNNDTSQCKGHMYTIHFELKKSISKNVPKNVRIDSLIFGNDEMGRWAYFKSVDLGYMKTITANIIIKVSEVNSTLDELSSYLIDKGIHLNTDQSDTDKKVFNDSCELYIVDNRWESTTYTKINSTYSYTLSMLGNFLDIEIKETIPQEVINQIPMEETQKNIASYK